VALRGGNELRIEEEGISHVLPGERICGCQRRLDLLLPSCVSVAARWIAAAKATGRGAAGHAFSVVA
jgi:hypothetical protein